jgi:hypothetical protein
MSELGRLFRAKLRPSRSTFVHPIVDLLRTRLSPTTLPKLASNSFDMQLFRILPIIDSGDIDVIADSFTKKPFSENFAPHIHKFQWSPTNLEEVLSVITANKSDHPHLIIVALYFVLAFLINVREYSDLITRENFEILMQAFRATYQSPFLPSEIFLFYEVVRLFVHSDTFEWDFGAVDAVAKHLLENKELDFTFSLLISDFLAHLALNPSEAARPLLSALCTLIAEKRNCIRTEHLPKLSPSLSEFLKVMDFEAMRLISVISTRSTTTDWFVFLGTLIVDYASGLPLVLAPAIALADPVKLPSISLGDFVSYPDSPSTFDRGFVGTPVPPAVPLEELLADSALLVFLVGLCDALKKAAPACIDVFVVSATYLILRYEDAERVWDMFCAGLFLLGRFDGQPEKRFAFVTDVRIFDPSLTIFRADFPREINALRHQALELLANSMADRVPDFLLKSAEFPLLCAELIQRLVTMAKLQIFVQQSALQAVLLVLHGLIKLHYSDASDGVFPALETTTVCLFQLLDDPDIEVTISSSRLLPQAFVGLVFVNVLRSLVFAKIRHFLVSGKHPGLYSCPFDLMKYCREAKESQCDAVIFALCEVLLYSLKMTSLDVPLGPILEYGFVRPSLEMVQYSLKFVGLASQFSSFHLNIECVKFLVETIRKVGATSSALLSLMSLCAGTSSMSLKTLFLIYEPEMILIIFAAFGESDQLHSIAVTFTELCKYSSTNCVLCHKAGVDLMLLDFIYNLFCKNENLVTCRGYSFRLNFQRSDVHSILFPFLSLIVSVQSNLVIADRFVRLVLAIEHAEISIETGKFLNSQMTQSRRKLTPVYPLGQSKPFCTVSNIPAQLLAHRFSFLFWIKIDVPVSCHSQTSTRVFAISNGQNHLMELFLNRDGLYLSANEAEFTPQCLFTIPSNTWTLLTFVAQKYQSNKIAVGLFLETDLVYCIDFPVIPLDLEGAMTLKLGGKGQGQKPFGFIGPFALSSARLDENQLVKVIQGQSHFDELPNFIIRTSSQGLDVRDFDIESELAPPVNDGTSLYSVMSQGDYVSSFLPLFANLSRAPEDLPRVVLGIMQQLPDWDPGYFSIIRQYLMAFSGEYLSYSLYIGFFSLFSVFADDILFDNLILVTDLWSQSPPDCFQKIIRHWSAIGMNACSSIFQRPLFFTRLLKLFQTLFVDKTTRLDRCRQSFVSLLEEVGKVNCTTQDVGYLFYVAFTATHPRLIVDCLQLVRHLSAHVSSIPGIADFLHVFVPSRIIHVAIAAIRAIYTLAPHQLLARMSAISYQLSNKAAIFEALLEQLPRHIGFVHLLSILAMGLDDSAKLKFINVLSAVEMSEAPGDFLGEKFWFLWLLLLATQLNSEALAKLMLFIAKAISLVSDFQACLDIFVDVIQILESVIDFDASALMLKLFVAINAQSLGYSDIFLNHCLRLLFFRFSSCVRNSTLLSAMNDSPFPPDSRWFRKPSRQLTSHAVVLRVIDQDFSGHRLHYGLGSDPESVTLLQFFLPRALEVRSPLDRHDLQLTYVRALRTKRLRTIEEGRSVFDMLNRGVLELQLACELAFGSRITQCLSQLKAVLHENEAASLINLVKIQKTVGEFSAAVQCQDACGPPMFRDRGPVFDASSTECQSFISESHQSLCMPVVHSVQDDICGRLDEQSAVHDRFQT